MDEDVDHRNVPLCLFKCPVAARSSTGRACRHKHPGHDATRFEAGVCSHTHNSACRKELFSEARNDEQKGPSYPSLLLDLPRRCSGRTKTDIFGCANKANQISSRTGTPETQHSRETRA